MSTESPYRVISIHLHAIKQLSPTMQRFTFESPNMKLIKTLAPDQRVKLFFPHVTVTKQIEWIDEQTPEWYTFYKNIPEHLRPPMRTYTIRNLKADQNLIDIDFAMHGATGPASTWAESAQIGDRLQIAAPNMLWQNAADEQGGFEWHPPTSAKHILLIADETALPAVAGIIEQLAEQNIAAQVDAFIEMPQVGDQIELKTHPNIHVQWMVREKNMLPGQQLLTQIQKLFKPKDAILTSHIEDIDVDEQILWFTQQQKEGSFYAWIAAESKAVLSMRRYLLQECGVDKAHLNCMGYWRLGKTFE